MNGHSKARASVPVNFGICAVAQGHADTVVGGVVTGEKQFFRPMLQTLKAQEHCCEAGIFVLPDSHPEGILEQNIVVFGDVGVNAVMTPQSLAATAVGTCAIAGGPYIDHPETCNGAAGVVPVDVFIPGCPPHPITILDGLLRALGKIEDRG